MDIFQIKTGNPMRGAAGVIRHLSHPGHLLLLLVLAAAVLCAAVSGCGTPPSSDPGSRHETRKSGSDDRPYVVLLSIDGFRHDYFDRYPTPNLQRLVASGARAEALIPVFPSLTFPNHYAIVTGMYADRHGIIANRFYDPEKDAVYTLSDPGAVTDSSWYRGEPLWATAEQQGVKSATFFWPGSEAAIAGVRPSYWKRYDGSVPNEARVDTVLSWLQLPAARRPHFITLYFSTVDHAGHEHGPASSEVQKAVRSVDAAVGRLMEGLEKLPISEEVYLVVVSDHGMERTGPEYFVALDNLVDITGIRVGSGGPVASLFVDGGTARARRVRDALNAGLENGQAYLRSELPETLHFDSDPRAGDVVVVMEAPYMINESSRRPHNLAGMHGWKPDDPDMHGIFVVSGPGVPAGKTLPAFENIHIYPYLAEVLGLRPNERIDGKAECLPALLSGREHSCAR